MGVTICGASLRMELDADMVDALDETPDTPDRVLGAYGALGGARLEASERASETGRVMSKRMSSISGPRWGRMGPDWPVCVETGRAGGVIVDAATEEGVFEEEFVASVMEVSALIELGGT
jgi:hypothetical protein